jgi:hypothetical protein
VDSPAPDRRPRLRAAHVIASLVVLTALGAVYAVDPATSRLFPPCLFHSLTGLQCPGCGGTRALHQLLHGNVGAAFRLNPLLFVVAAAAPVVALQPALASRPWFAWTAAAVLVGWGVLRNLI